MSLVSFSLPSVSHAPQIIILTCIIVFYPAVSLVSFVLLALFRLAILLVLVVLSWSSCCLSRIATLLPATSISHISVITFVPCSLVLSCIVMCPAEWHIAVT